MVISLILELLECLEESARDLQNRYTNGYYVANRGLNK